MTSLILTPSFLMKICNYPKRGGVIGHSNFFVGLQGITGELGLLHMSSYLIHLLDFVFLWNSQSFLNGLRMQSVAHLFLQFFSLLHGTSTHLYDSNSCRVLGSGIAKAVHQTKTRNSITDVDAITFPIMTYSFYQLRT